MRPQNAIINLSVAAACDVSVKVANAWSYFISTPTSLNSSLIIGEGSAEKLLTDMGAEELLSFVKLDVNAAVG